MGIDSLIICILYDISEDEFGLSLANKISNLLHTFKFKVQIIDDYCLLDTSQNIFLLDATFEKEVFGEADLLFPILKIFKPGQDLKKVYFYDFILYPFSDEELISRIFNSYNSYRNIKYFQEVNNKFKSYLLNLSHDVYSPIKLVKSQIEYLQINAVASGTKHYNKIFDSTISQLSNIADILLSVPYSSIAFDSIEVEENSQNIVFSSLLNNIVNQLELYALNQGVEIKLSIQESVKNSAVKSSYSYLWRMVYNLLTNAIKYCVGGGVIKILLSSCNKILRWEIIDSGIGMSLEQLENVRQYLYDKNQEEIFETDAGFGRGLVVVKLVASSLKAAIKVESELGVGTTFIIDFPLDDI